MTLQPLFNYSLLFKSLFSKKKFTSNILLKSGRMAFNHILSTIKKKKPNIKNILLPNLICEEIVSISKLHNIEVSYYSIDEKLNFNINEINELSNDGNNIILIVNYFGFLFNQEKMKFFNKINNFIIEDNAHVLRNESVNNNLS